MAFHVGQRVVRVTTGPWEVSLYGWHKTHPGGPETGQVCVITYIFRYDDDPGDFLELEGWPDAYSAEAFDPVVYNETDCSVGELCDA